MSNLVQRRVPSCKEPAYYCSDTAFAICTFLQSEDASKYRELLQTAQVLHMDLQKTLADKEATMVRHPTLYPGSCTPLKGTHPHTGIARRANDPGLVSSSHVCAYQMWYEQE